MWAKQNSINFIYQQETFEISTRTQTISKPREKLRICQ